MNGRRHNAAAAPAGSRFQGSRGKTGICTPLSKEAGRGRALPGGDGTSGAERLRLIYFPPHSPLQSVAAVLWNFPISASHWLFCASAAPFSGSVLRGTAVPQQPVCASAEITSILSGVGGIILLLPTIITTRATSGIPL